MALQRHSTSGSAPVVCNLLAILVPNGSQKINGIRKTVTS